MSGPKHYSEAEELVRSALRFPDSSDALVLVQAALVRAHLAQTAMLLDLAGIMAAAHDIGHKGLMDWYEAVQPGGEG